MAGRGTPEQQARELIDAALVQAGWVVQNREDMNLGAGPGVAVREFPIASGPAVYLLFVDGRPVGALEAKKVGYPLAGVEFQVEGYAEGLPPELDAPIRPLPFQVPQQRRRDGLLQPASTLGRAAVGSSPSTSRRRWRNGSRRTRQRGPASGGARGCARAIAPARGAARAGAAELEVLGAGGSRHETGRAPRSPTSSR